MGTQMNEKVALELMGWQHRDYPAEGKFCLSGGTDWWRHESWAEDDWGCNKCEEIIPKYSEKWCAAGEVIEKMQRDGYGVEIKDSVAGWYCRMFTRPNESIDTWTFGKTFPEAVCKTALLVKEDSNGT